MISGLGLLLGILSPVTSSLSFAAANSVAMIRECSIADNQVVKIASWDLDGAVGRVETGPVVSELASMIAFMDADLVALQGVTGYAEEVPGALRSLRETGRCYQALVSAAGDATLFDPKELELLYAESPVLDCDGKSSAPSALRSRTAEAAQAQPGQLSYFRVRDSGRANAFDFVILNADIARVPDDLARLAEQYNHLDQDYPWLSDEMDRIVLGDLAIDGALLNRDYFPQTKPLINLLLKINVGLSDKSFDEAVAGTRAPSGDRADFNDNILVRRWDRPGTCNGAGYCGGLEEFINARVYATGKAGSLAKVVHPPVAARFCKRADSDPEVAKR
jgi:hypothetical protein